MYNKLRSNKYNPWKEDIQIFRYWKDKISGNPMIISLRMNKVIWFFHFRYLPPIEIYHRNIFHWYKQTNKHQVKQRIQWSIIKEDKRRCKDMKKYIINWDQTNTTHEKKISKYSDIGKIRYQEIQW